MKSRLKPVNKSVEKRLLWKNIFKLFGSVPARNFSCHLVFVATVMFRQSKACI